MYQVLDLTETALSASSHDIVLTACVSRHTAPHTNPRHPYVYLFVDHIVKMYSSKKLTLACDPLMASS